MTGTWAVTEKLTVPGVLGVPVAVLGAGVAETFKHVPILLGRQLVHGFPAFTQAQPLHEPVLLHLQQATISFVLCRILEAVRLCQTSLPE